MKARQGITIDLRDNTMHVKNASTIVTQKFLHSITKNINDKLTFEKNIIKFNTSLKREEPIFIGLDFVIEKPKKETESNVNEIIEIISTKLAELINDKCQNATMVKITDLTLPIGIKQAFITAGKDGVISARIVSMYDIKYKLNIVRIDICLEIE